MKKYFFTIIIASIPLIYFFMIGTEMPDQVVVHWNAQGEADDFGSKYFYLFLSAIPMLIIIFNIIYQKYNTVIDNMKYQYKIIDALVIFFSILAIALTNASTSEELIIARLIVILISGLFIYLGNIFNKLKMNRSFGIRIPATLKSEIVWNRTHYIGGYLFVVCGVVSLIGAILIPNETNALILMLILLVLVLVLIIGYAEVLYRRETGHSSLAK